MARFDEIDATPGAQGYLAVATERGDRVYLLAARTVTDATPPTLDWRAAPIAEAFFRAAPGEPYAIEIGDRVTEGTVRERWVIARRDGSLIGDDRIERRDGSVELRPRPAPAPGHEPQR